MAHPNYTMYTEKKPCNPQTLALLNKNDIVELYACNRYTLDLWVYGDIYHMRMQHTLFEI